MPHAIASNGGKANPLENVLDPQGLIAEEAFSLVLSTRITSSQTSGIAITRYKL